jgi:predicted alpha/beta hydrolase
LTGSWRFAEPLEKARHRAGFFLDKTLESLTLITDDGQPLAARAFKPSGGVLASRAVIIATALGVPQSFYERYARWLVQQGCVVYTFDWRGMGQSAPASLRGYRAKLSDWALHDAPAVMAAVAQRHPELPISWFGHSMGGILYGLMPQHPRIDQVVTLGSGSGYNAHLGRPLRYVIHAFWHVLVPLSVARHGYFAGSRIKAVGDVPRGVIAQWKRWSQHPDFVLSESEHARRAYAQVRVPITAVMVDDDVYASHEGVLAQHAHYRHAPVTQVLLKPREHGVRAIGHFNFFHARTGPRVWALSRAWLGLPDQVVPTTA